MIAAGAPAALAALVWVWLLTARGGYWRTDVRLPAAPSQAGPDEWPSVTIVVPARNEAEVLPITLPTLLGQRYPGRMQVVVVDDDSDDGTSEAAERAAARVDGARVQVVPAGPLPAGWAGKVWAMRRGAHAAREADAQFVLFTDADVAHPPDSLRRLVLTALDQRLDLVSVMARLRTETWSERLLIPAFVYFFGLLYPFRWSNDPARSTAAAAGGCMLVRRRALERVGGLQAIRAEVIDDCALAARIKHSGGRTWLGLARSVRSVRAYGGVPGVWHVAARTAYTQLGYSPSNLAGTVLGMLAAFAAPPAAVAAGLAGLCVSSAAAAPLAVLAAGAAGWTLSAVSYAPMTRWYGRSMLHAASLPLAAVLYTAMTLDSARRHAAGSGGRWKGRTYAPPR